MKYHGLFIFVAISVLLLNSCAKNEKSNSYSYNDGVCSFRVDYPKLWRIDQKFEPSSTLRLVEYSYLEKQNVKTTLELFVIDSKFPLGMPDSNFIAFMNHANSEFIESWRLHPNEGCSEFRKITNYFNRRKDEKLVSFVEFEITVKDRGRCFSIMSVVNLNRFIYKVVCYTQNVNADLYRETFKEIIESIR